ncbi:AAEL013338-PA [Aedes aegypti]|uniref:AAEL013338-PA n=2 Tax=Aedes aegypti TaxID=7159 RepID=A0A1S4FYR5_AEDAE|nr:protein lethal(2)essential for life [Aedes aegypti]EAT34414.1 AAEL013338-PA [Aedes aegypti]
MSIVPIMFRDWWDDHWDTPLRQSRILDQHFGSGISSDDLLTAITSAAAAQSAVHNQLRRPIYNRPWRHSSLAPRQDIGSTIHADKDKFQINLDVQQFSPTEISVKASDNSIIIEGKHDEKQDDHGFISRHFVRRYMLPPGHDSNQIKSTISSDGILTISAPKKAIMDSAGQKTIPIVQTGQPLKKIAAEPEKKA